MESKLYTAAMIEIIRQKVKDLLKVSDASELRDILEYLKKFE